MLVQGAQDYLLVNGAIRYGASPVGADGGHCAQGAVPQPEDGHLLPAHAKRSSLPQRNLFHGAKDVDGAGSPSGVVPDS